MHDKRLNLGTVLMLGTMILILTLFFWIFRPTYKEGRLPVKDESRYFVYVKQKVFEKCVNRNKHVDSLLNIKDMFENKKTVVLKAGQDTAKFIKLLMGEDRLDKQTAEKFEGQGFESGVILEFNNKIPYFTLPIEETMGADNFIKVPAWLMANLVDNGVLNTSDSLESKEGSQLPGWLKWGLAVVALLALGLWLRKNKVQKQ